MKNIEKYKDILFNICVKDQDHFMVTKDGNIRTCVWKKADCKDCKLYKKFISCKELRLNWLNEDFIPTFYIDKADKAFLLNPFVLIVLYFSFYYGLSNYLVNSLAMIVVAFIMSRNYALEIAVIIITYLFSTCLFSLLV